MKKLLLLICLLPLFAQAQFTNQTVRKTIATGTLSTNPGLDTIPRVTGVLTNGYVLMFNSSLNKWYAVDPSTFSPSLSVSTVSPGGYANGLNYAAGVFRLGKVSATNPGVLTTGTDTIAGVKRFNNIIFTQGGVLSAGDISVSASGNPSISVISTAGNATGRISRFNSGSTASLDFQTNGGNTWELSTLPTSSDFTIRNATGSVDAIRVNNSTNALTLSSLTTGSVYSSSGTLTNTAPTSGTIGYWSRNSGTGTLTTATGTDAVTLGGALSGTSATFSGGVEVGNGLLRVNTNFTGTQLSGSIYNESTSGIVIYPKGGSSYDFLFTNKNGQSVLRNPTGTQDINLFGALTGTSATFTGAVAVNTNDITQNGTRPVYTMQQSGTTRLIQGIADSGDDFIAGTVSGDVAYRKNGGNFLWSVDNGSTAALKIASDNTVRATTQSAGDNSTKVATTAYVDNAAYSGTYTPTPSNEVNIASLTVNQFMYSRVGNVVTGSGDINIDPTAASQVQVRLTLPIASNFTSTVDANGGLFGYEQNGSDLKADPTNDAFTLSYEATATNLRTMKVWFQYIVK